MRLKLMVMGTAALVATAATAHAAPQDDAQAAKGPEDKASEEMICKRQEANLGSRISRKKKVCMTKAQWDAQSAASSAAADETKRNSSTAMTGQGQ